MIELYVEKYSRKENVYVEYMYNKSVISSYEGNWESLFIKPFYCTVKQWSPIV